MRAGKWVLLVCATTGTLVTCSKDDHLLNNPADPQSPAYVGHEVLSPHDPANFPTVRITNAPATIKINVPYTYVAAATDSNKKALRPGTIVRYTWVFAGTAKPDSTASCTHAFTTAGVQTVSVIAVDNDTNAVTATKTVTITNLPPIANAHGPYTVKINVPLTLNGTGTDPDGTVVKYEWDFESDGTFDWSSTSTGTTQHTYATQGAHTATLRVTDDDGNTAAATAQVTVTNEPPVPNAHGPYTVKINVPLTLNGTGTDPDGTVVKYEWDFESDGTYDWSSTSTGSTQHTYTTQGTHTATLRVTDEDGNTATATAQVSVTNLPPVPNAGGPYTVKINVPLTLNGTGTDADGNLVKYEWDFESDGTYDWSSTSTGSTQHTYTTQGTHTATLRVTDDDGNTATATAQVEANPNLPPVANAGGPYVIKIRKLLTILGTGSDPDGRIVKFEWDFEGDATYEWSSPSTGLAQHTFETAGVRSASFRVTDDDGNTVVSTAQITVTDLPPVPNAGGPYTTKINVAVSFAGTAADPDGAVAKYEWDFENDGIFDWSSFATGAAQHAYVVPGDYTATLRVTDDDGNTTTATAQVTVNPNTPPQANAGGPYAVTVKNLWTVLGTGTDTDGRIVKWEWDFEGDGVFEWSSNSNGLGQHTYTTTGARAVNFRVTDDDGATATATALVTVTSLPPVPNARGPYTVKINVPLTLNGTATDDISVSLYEWDFDGDGTYDWSSGSTGSTQHTYAVAGVYTATLRATDGDGNTATATAQVTVTNQSPVPDAGGPFTIKVNVPLTLNGTATDDGRIVLFEWDFDGDGTFDWSFPATGSMQHTYTAAGVYQAVLRVTDDDGNSAVGTAQVTVTSLPPVPQAGGPYTVKIKVPVTLNGSASDPDGSIAKYEWDLDGDGTYDWTSTSTGLVQHAYLAAGNYTATLRVVDDDGNTATTTANVTVTDNWPVLNAGGPYSVEHNIPLMLNGLATDDGTIVRFEWDFDGDGTFDWSSTTTGAVQRTFGTIGSHNATFRAQDDDGHVSSVTVQIVVHGVDYSKLQYWRSLSGHTGNVQRVAYTPDGQTIVSKGSDYYTKAWRYSDGYMLRSVGPHGGTFAVTPDGQAVVVGEQMSVYSLPSLQYQRGINSFAIPMQEIAITPDGATVIGSDPNAEIRAFNFAGEFRYVVQAAVISNEPRIVAYPDGQNFIFAGNTRIETRRVSDGTLLRTLPLAGDAGHTEGIRSIAFSSDGQTLVSAGNDNLVKVWRVSDGALLRTLTGPTLGASCVAVSPDGQTIVAGGGDGMIRFWNLSDGALLHTIAAGNTVFSLAIRPDGRGLLVGAGSTVEIWQMP
ncbi:MAG TPA: PKD domain-containing protein [Candidatus Latescibacteria bacterium]|nr:PKD domain-containing protein [Candidatus Latescibacterota bacterium]